MEASAIDFIGLFILLAGFIVGLGAVTVIDIHGFLARSSHYWTEATIRSHKITKPLIWVGLGLALIGGLIFYHGTTSSIPLLQAVLGVALVANGIFLSFCVSPYLIKLEKKKKIELLPKDLQIKITASFIVSFVGWWTELGLLVWYLLTYM